MAEGPITNPTGAFGLPLAGFLIAGATPMTNDRVVITMQNGSGAARQYGDVLSTDVTGLVANTSTTIGDKNTIGVVDQQPGPNYPVAGTLAPNLSGSLPIIIKGVGRVQIAANVVAAGDLLQQSGVAVTAITNNAAVFPAFFAIALEASGAKDTNNTIRAKVL